MLIVTVKTPCVCFFSTPFGRWTPCVCRGLSEFEPRCASGCCLNGSLRYGTLRCASHAFGRDDIGGARGGRGEDEKTRSGEVEGLAVLGRPQGSPLRVDGGGLNGRSKVKVQSAKLWDPDFIGMAF